MACFPFEGGPEEQQSEPIEADLPLPDLPVCPRWWESPGVSSWLARAEASLVAGSVRVNDGQIFTSLLDPSNRYFAGVGADRVWPVSIRLASLLDDPRSGLGLEGTSGMAVELGAGACALPGMLLARRGMRVVLTDLPWLLPLTALNVAANFPGDDPRRPLVVALRWGSTADLATFAPPDLVVGADIAYHREDLEPLLDTIVALRAKRTLLGLQHRNGLDRAVAEAAAARGITVQPIVGYCCARASVLELRA